jgi:hypothetical protein
MAYVDEAGFAHAQPNRSAWTHINEVHSVLIRLVPKPTTCSGP